MQMILFDLICVRVSRSVNRTLYHCTSIFRVYFNLKLEAAWSSETQLITPCHNPEDIDMNLHRRKNNKFSGINLFLLTRTVYFPPHVIESCKEKDAAFCGAAR